MPDRMKEFFASLSPAWKFFLAGWLLLLAYGLILLASLQMGFFSDSLMEEKLAGMKGNPQVQMQISALKRQGMNQSSLDRQLEQIVAPVVDLCAMNRQKCLLYGLLALLAAGLLILALRKPQIAKESKRLLLAGLVAILLVQGFHMAARYIVPDPRDFENIPDGLRKIASLDKLYRVHAMDRALYNNWISEYFPLLQIPCINVPADSRPSIYRKLFFYSEKFPMPRRLLYANVGYVLCSPKEMGYLVGLGLQMKAGKTFSVEGVRQQICEVEKPLPRYFAPQRTQVVKDAEKALSIMGSKNNNPLETLLLHEDNAFASSETSGTNTVALVNFAPEKVELKCDFGHDGYAVLACEPLSGWYAVVDGQKKPVQRCNLMHQCVPVPKGVHQVAFVYDLKQPGALACNLMHVIFLPLLALATIALLVIKSRAKAA